MSPRLCSFPIVFIAILSLSFIQIQNIAAQHNNIVSPIVLEDGSVKFQLFAPGAEEVFVVADWGLSIEQKQKMRSDSTGKWSFTSPPLPSDLYFYRFEVDGVWTNDPSNSYVYRDVSRVFNLVLIPNGDGDFYGVKNVAHGSISYTWYHSEETDEARRLCVYTPPHYDSNDRKYPVLYLLHGSGGDEEAWLTLGRLPMMMDNLIADNRIAPMIVVMPNGNLSKQAAPGQTFENFDYLPVSSHQLPLWLKGGYEMNFDEIVAFTEQRYRAKNSKSQRAISGLSMGGFHTLYISANHPNSFDYVGIFSPATPYYERYRPDTALTVYANLDQKLLIQSKKGYEQYWIAMGKDDFLHESLDRYRSKLDSLKFQYTYKESNGHHSWSNWRKYMLEFLPLLFRENEGKP